MFPNRHNKWLNIAKHLYYLEDFRCPKTIQYLSEDLELAEAVLKEYVTLFKFDTMSLIQSFRAFLKVLWPEDEPKLQHLFLTHFSRQFVNRIFLPFRLESAVYNLSWAIILLNADLNGGHKGRKITCEEFIANMKGLSMSEYPQVLLKDIFKSVKKEPLEVFRVNSKHQDMDELETLVPLTDDNLNTMQKTGYLMCKQVMDANGKKTRKGQRAWKPFSALLKGMVLYLQKDTSEVCEFYFEKAIRLHHAMAYPVRHRKRPHVLCLRTADSRLVYFQAESEVERTSWVTTINHVAARYSAPPLTSASHDIHVHHPHILPSYPTTLSLKQQLKHHKDQMQRFSGLMLYCTQKNVFFYYMAQEQERYKKYVRVLQELVTEDCSYANSHQSLPERQDSTEQ